MDKSTVKSMAETARMRRLAWPPWVSHRDLWSERNCRTIIMREARELINKSEGVTVSSCIFTNRCAEGVDDGTSQGKPT